MAVAHIVLMAMVGHSYRRASRLGRATTERQRSAQAQGQLIVTCAGVVGEPAYE